MPAAIVEPTAEPALTPICPHSTRSSGYVLSRSTSSPWRYGRQPQVRLSVRGRRQGVL
ncbi:MAG: hypothetical protein ACLUIX_10725 [Oscillospiraceae bacterium]